MAAATVIAIAAIIGAAAATKSAVDTKEASDKAAKRSKRESGRQMMEQDQLKRSVAQQEDLEERTRLRDERRSRARSVLAGGRRSTILSGPLGQVEDHGDVTGKIAIGS